MRDWPPNEPEGERPENVRVVTTDGRVIPVDCVYEGKQRGTHVWKVTTEYEGVLSEVLFDSLPARTELNVPVKYLPPGDPPGLA